MSSDRADSGSEPPGDASATGKGDALNLLDVALAIGGSRALGPLDWTVPRGSVGLIAGPAGAGKSVLLEICALARRADGGKVVVLGEDPHTLGAEGRAALRRRIGWSPQSPRFLAHLDVADNLAVPLRLNGVGARESRAQAREVLDWLGLGDRGAEAPERLSLGDRRRAALGRAVIAGPELILADDPASGLDAASADLATQLLRTLVEHGATVIATSVDTDMARLLGGRARTLHLPEAIAPLSEVEAA